MALNNRASLSLNLRFEGQNLSRSVTLDRNEAAAIENPGSIGNLLTFAVQIVMPQLPQ
jgi:hypothetical protein